MATKLRLLGGSPTATHPASTDVTPSAEAPSLPRSGFVRQEGCRERLEGYLLCRQWLALAVSSSERLGAFRTLP